MRAFLVAFGVFLALIGAEVSTRLYYRLAHRVPILSFDSLAPVIKPTGWHGKQYIGDLATSKPRLLIVGDSMTHGLGFAREEDLYYHVVAQVLGVEVFAYGGAGFGTLQESMVIEQYVPLVKPDLVVLQVCINDFVNNSWEIESRSYLNNNFFVRPYWEDGQVRYRYPSRFGDPTVITGRSRFAHWVFQQSAQVGAELSRKKILYLVEEELSRKDFPPLQRSFAVTETLVRRLKDSLDAVRIPLLVFAGDDVPGWAPYWRPIVQRQGVPFFEGVPDAVRAEEQRLGTSIRPDTSHWDARGHQAVGRALAPWLRQYLPR